MPAKFNAASMRDYIKDTWGLGPGRQSSVLLYAMAQSVSNDSRRLPSVAAAKELLDSAVSAYASSCSLSLQKASGGASGQQQAASTTIDSAALAKLSEDQRRLAIMQHKTLSNYLGIENSSDTRVVELEQSQHSLQNRLDLWAAEFGEDFENGIKPSFNVKHLRKFNFWWNQARIEIYNLYNDCLCKKNLQCMPSSLLQFTANKCSQQALRLIRDLVDNGEDNESHFTDIGNQLIGMIGATTSQPPKATFSLPFTRPHTVIRNDGSIKNVEIPRFKSQKSESYLALLRQGMRRPAAPSGPFISLRASGNGHWPIDDAFTEALFEGLGKIMREGHTFSHKVFLITGAGPGSLGAELVRKLLMGGATVIVTTSRAISDAQIFYRKMYAESGARGSELYLLPFNQGSVQDCRNLVDYIYNESGLGLNVDAIIPFAAISEKGVEIDNLDSKSELAHRLMLINVLRLIGLIIQTKKSRNISCRPTQVLLPLSPNHGTFGADGLYTESKLGLEGLLNRFSSESWGEQATICGVIIGWTRGTGLMAANDIVAETIESNGALTFLQDEMAMLIMTLLTPAITKLYETEGIVADLSGGLRDFKGLKELMTTARLDMRRDAEIKKALYEEDMLERSIISGDPLKVEPKESIRRIKPHSTIKVGFPHLPQSSDLDRLRPSLDGMVNLESTVVIVGFSELGPWGNARTRWEMESRRKFSDVGCIEMAWIMGLIKHFDGERADGHYIGWVDAETGEPVEDSMIQEKYGEYIHNHAGIRLVEPHELPGFDPNKKEYMQEIAIEENMPEFDATKATADAFKLKHGKLVSIKPTDDPETFRVQIKAGAHISVAKASPFSNTLVAGLLPTGWDPARYGITEDLIRQLDTISLYTLCCVAEALYSAGIENAMELFEHIHLSDIGNFIGSGNGGSLKARELYRDIYLDKQVQGDVLQETFLNTPAAWVNMLLFGSTGPIKTPVGACATAIESMDNGVESIISGKTKICLVGGTDNFQEDVAYGFATMKATVNAQEQFAQGRTPSEFSRPAADTRGGFMESHGCGVQIICSADLALKMGLPIYAIVAGTTMASDKIGRSIPAPGKGILTFARETEDAVHSPLLNLEYRRTKMQQAISQCLQDSEVYDSDSADEAMPSELTPPYSTPQTPPSSNSDCDDYEFTPMSKASAKRAISNFIPSDYLTETELNSRLSTIRKQWGNNFREQNPLISPLRASLAVWGLTVNDIGVASLHGTSTKANDINESEVINQQMEYLGRRGAPILAVCQKAVTGHPKAPAAAWMLNGCLQVLNSGLVPGNFNCDNIEPRLAQFEHLLWPTESTQMNEVKAFVLTSFGFGQKGGQMIGVAPKYLFATLPKTTYDYYVNICTKRKRSANRAFAKAFMSNSIFKAHEHNAYAKDQESKVFLDPLARVTKNSTTGEYRFGSFPKLRKSISRVPSLTSLAKASQENDGNLRPPTLRRTRSSILTTSTQTKDALHGLFIAPSVTGPVVSIGADVENVRNFTSDQNTTFLERNYTAEERRIASVSRDPHAMLVARWCAKEAVFKSLSAKSRGAGAAMNDIEIWNDENGAPKVRLTGAAMQAAQDSGVVDVLLSISYGDDNVVAVAVSVSA
ncbi:phosphopantetheine-protein transferase [Xylogone sp. PMI_703]|nr:phosphopantetheine-protein transferase [Xylogone sp. PMI_703]